MIHEEKTQIILLGHKEELLSSSFDMKEYIWFELLFVGK